MKKKLPHRLVRELCEDCPDDHYCLFKELVERCAIIDDRLIIQMKCIEIFKYEESKGQNKPIDWNEAITLWAERGYAERFAIVYDELVKNGNEIHPRPTYKNIVEY